MRYDVRRVAKERSKGKGCKVVTHSVRKRRAELDKAMSL